MSPRGPDLRLTDIITAIDAITTAEAQLHAAGIDRTERVRVSAIVRELSIIGEAVSTLPTELTAREPTIPWRDIAGIRILLDHHYHRVDEVILWHTVDQDLAPLRAATERLLEDDA